MISFRNSHEANRIDRTVNNKQVVVPESEILQNDGMETAADAVNIVGDAGEVGAGPFFSGSSMLCDRSSTNMIWSPPRSTRLMLNG